MCCSDWVGVRGGGGTVCDVHIRHVYVRAIYQQVWFFLIIVLASI